MIETGTSVGDAIADSVAGSVAAMNAYYAAEERAIMPQGGAQGDLVQLPPPPDMDTTILLSMPVSGVPPLPPVQQ